MLVPTGVQRDVQSNIQLLALSFLCLQNKHIDVNSLYLYIIYECLTSSLIIEAKNIIIIHEKKHFFSPSWNFCWGIFAYLRNKNPDYLLCLVLTWSCVYRNKMRTSCSFCLWSPTVVVFGSKLFSSQSNMSLGSSMVQTINCI